MSENPESRNTNLGFAQRSETWMSVAFLMTLVVLIIPLPTFLLDMFIAINLASAIMLLLITLNAKKALDVSVFPSLLLLMTLFRLSLNVATTRLILLDGDAGKIVDTFGGLVVGGSLVVGSVIFVILVTIQFIVITKGATRISEVNARFTLDAMPGKQMAIDSELNMGAINEKQAKQRRQELASEAEFYGAMDGASKYVRGDAIAGLVIMVVNLVGGVVISVVDGNTIADAFSLYSILTIGDGLISQIPALIIATSAGVLVTKSSSDSNLGDEIGQQMVKGHRALFTGAIILALLALVPGLPKLPFLGLAGVMFVVVKKSQDREKVAEEDEKTAAEQETEEVDPTQQNLNQFLQNDRIVVEIGVGVISLVEPKKGKGLADRISVLRNDIGRQFGFWVPNIRIRDNLQMGVNEYRIHVCGRCVGKDSLQPNDLLAIDPDGTSSSIGPMTISDPAFGLPAKWIASSERRRAEIEGLTVVDSSTVLITHLGELLKKHASELLSREDLQKMLDKLKEYAPTIVSELKPDTLRPGVLHQLLVNLMAESVPITALEKIVESAIHHSVLIKDVDELTEKVRADIGPIIVERFRNAAGKVRVILLEPRLEHFLRENAEANMISLKQEQLERLVEKYKQQWELTSLKDGAAAALVDSSIRRPLRQTLFRSLPELSFVAYHEIPGEILIDPISVISFQDVLENGQGHTGSQTESDVGSVK